MGGPGKDGKMRRWIAAGLAAILLTGCVQAERKQEFDVQYFDYFDTFTMFTVYAEDEEQFEEYKALVESELENYHQLFDIYHSYNGVNNIKTINDNAGITPVKVDKEIIKLLKISGEEYDKTGGRVNVAMGSVLSLWHEYRTYGKENPERAELPGRQALEKAAMHMDMEKVQIDEDKALVYLEDPDMSLDLGAVAKGYTAQRICERLRAAGADSALISIGGNVQAIGAKGSKSPWRVGVQSPDTSKGQSYLHALNLQDLALVTSGIYQRFYEVDGMRYHHIIDPETLMPRREFASVTILSPNGAEADALSTAVFNMPLQEGQELIESLENTEAFWVYEDGREVFSSGFRDYVTN